jgi:hypothetical protein
MSPTMHGNGSPVAAGSPFALPAAQRRIGSERQGEERPARLLTMLAVAFLLASPVITVLLAVQ